MKYLRKKIEKSQCTYNAKNNGCERAKIGYSMLTLAKQITNKQQICAGPVLKPIDSKCQLLTYVTSWD